MKRAIISLVLCFVCIINFSACSNEIHYNVYIYQNPETDIFSNSPPRIDIASEIKTEISPKDVTIAIGDKILDLVHTANILEGEKVVQNVYTNTDNSIEYKKYTNYESFSVSATTISNKTVPLLEYNSPQLTEEKLVEHGKKYMAQFINDIDYSKYTYSISTCYAKFYENGVSSQNTDYFHMPKDETEQIQWYAIKFTEYCNGLATSNCIRFHFDGNGNLKHIFYSHKNADWASVEFDDDKISESIDAFLDSYTSKKIISYEVNSKTLIFYQNKIMLSISVTINAEINNGEYNIPCVLYISTEPIS